jgi:predicted NBD/HSP70 family sugar kinase
MASPPTLVAQIGAHGASELPSVTLTSWNIELRDGNGFIGDRASKGAFSELLALWRERFREKGDDPLGNDDEIGRKKLEKILAEGSPEAAGLVHSAIEDFAQQFSGVIQRFLKTKEWKGIEKVAVGGGLSASRLGELAIGRTAVLLKAEGHDIELQPIHHDPDEAGLIGAAHLAPAWIFSGHDAILAADIGGTNIRTGIVVLNIKKAKDLSQALVHKVELWRHKDDKPSREEAVERLGKMLESLMAEAKKAGIGLAPFIGLGCPGFINEDGTIDRGAQNLPGNWHSKKFNLPLLIAERIPMIGEHATSVLMHNDAVLQGLSELPWMTDVSRWGVLTIGTGLGNACFVNRDAADEKKPKRKSKKG